MSDHRVTVAAKALYAHPISNGSGNSAPEIITQCEDAARTVLDAIDKAARQQQAEHLRRFYA